MTMLAAAIPLTAVDSLTGGPTARAFDWDLLLKAMGSLVAVTVAYIQARGLQTTSRTLLKTDLEILKLLDPADPSHETVKRSIDLRVTRLYAPRPLPSRRLNPKRVGLALFGLLWALGFSYWTFALVRPGFTWWSLLTGYMALAGLGWLLMGVTGRGAGRSPDPAADAPPKVDN